MGTRPMRIAINAGGAFVAGLNTVLAGAVFAADELGCEVVGIRDGYEGLLFRDRYPDGGMIRFTPSSVETIIDSAQAGFGASRVNPFQVRVVEDEMVEEVDRSGHFLDVAREEGIDALINVVGRRAMSVSWKLARRGLPTVCVPVSVENDVAATGLSFGFNSALGFAIDLLSRTRAAASASHRIAVVELLGAHAGWLALQAGMAALADAILIPEIPYALGNVAERLSRNDEGGRRPALVVVAEGARAAAPEAHEDAEGALEKLRRALSPGASERTRRMADGSSIAPGLPASGSPTPSSA